MILYNIAILLVGLFFIATHRPAGLQATQTGRELLTRKSGGHSPRSWEVRTAQIGFLAVGVILVVTAIVRLIA